MWSQNWDSLMPLVLPDSPDLEAAFQAIDYSVMDMVRLAEDFYRSLGLPRLPQRFWLKSQFVKPQNRSDATCHGVAADMFADDDYRYPSSNRCESWPSGDGLRDI